MSKLLPRSWRDAFETGTTLLVLVVAILALRAYVQPAKSKARPELPLPKDLVAFDGAARGAVGARVGMIIYSDFQCPFCGSFARDTMPQVINEYVTPGKMRVVFRNFPLEKIHPLAKQAAIASACAGEQGKFWELHDNLFQRQAELSANVIDGAVHAAGLENGALARCINTTGAASVKRDIESADTLLVSEYPTFFLGTFAPDGRLKVERRLSGNSAPAAFEQIIDSLLKAVGNP